MVAEETKLTRIAKLVDDRVNELKGVKTQREIAAQAGYKNQNMISMIKQGEAKVALDRVMGLAAALEVEPGVMMTLALEQFYSRELIRDLMSVLSEPFTAGEIDIILYLRQLTVEPKLTAALRKALDKVYAVSV